jgi:hypothetical protein
MAKRKRIELSPTGDTFSLMDGDVDILEGLVMHKEAISEQFEKDLISFVQRQCAKGRKGELKKPTYLRASGTRSQGNQREAIMYGGFFDFNRARPGKRGLVPPFPPILERLVEHLVSNKYIPEEVRPDSCIINQYNTGDCIPPHVDHSSYYRPISTLSLLGEEPMLVGSRFRTVKSCTWVPTCGKSVPLPRRSLLVLGGNSGNIAKHCISACEGQRISITLRKQPPPDWKPNESELVGKGGQRSQYRNGSRMNNDAGQQPTKKKSLSGSAKRRKKMLKTMNQNSGRSGIGRSGIGKSGSGNNGNGGSGNTKKYGYNIGSSSSSSSSGNGMFALQNMSKKERKALAKKESERNKRVKQARRNARRLAKKKESKAAESKL